MVNIFGNSHLFIKKVSLQTAQHINPEDDDEEMDDDERHFYNWAAYTLIEAVVSILGQ